MNSIVDAYFKDIKDSKPLTKEQELELAKQAQNGDEQALNKLINANLRFVVTVARQFQGRGLSLEDLIAEGNIGLIEAAKRFNPDEGYRFISYGVWYIQQSIQAAISNNKLIRLPMNRINNSITINRVINRYQEKEGRKPTEKELSTECGISIQDIRLILRTNQFALNLDQRLDSEDEDADTLESILSNPDDKWADEDVTNDGLRADLLTLLNRVLSPRESTILIKSFGIGVPEESDEKIAKALDVTSERVRQLKLQSLHKLRHCTDQRIMQSLKNYLG